MQATEFSAQNNGKKTGGAHRSFLLVLKKLGKFATITKKKGGETAVELKNGFIGVFDSGVGGISVLKELVSLMPGENYLYYGDSANAPYGRYPTEKVRQLTVTSGNRSSC